MKKLSLLFTLFLSVIITHGQTNYYVSPAGNNFNTGTLALPWLTIQHGLNQLSNNDTLNILTGTYNEKISIPASSVYLRSYASSSPIIDAIGITSQNAIIEVSNKSNVTISGLELKNNIQNDAQGILIDGSGSNITIENCIIHDIHFSSNVNALVNANTNAQGIIVYGSNATEAISNLTIQNNQLYNCRLGFSEGIAVNGNVDGFVVAGNTVYNLTNIGIDVIGHEGTCSNPANDQARNGLVKNNMVYACVSDYATSGGIYVDGGKLTTIENNTSHHNGYGIEVGCENVGKTTEAIIVRNNVFYNNEICAIAIGGYAYPSGSGKVINATVRNNTCYFNDYSNSGTGELYLSYSENTVIENNIFYTNSENTLGYAELSQPALNFNYNNIYCQAGANSLIADWNGSAYEGYDAFNAGSGTNANSIFANPQFVLENITDPDFHLLPSSPCVNTGNPSFIPSVNEVDLDGELRVNGTVDCGADEYYSTTGISENTSRNQYFLYPNPATSHVYLSTVGKDMLGATVQLCNLMGQPVKSYLFDGGVMRLDLESLPSGSYIVTIKKNNDLWRGKVLKL